MLNHILNQIIIGLVITALQLNWLFLGKIEKNKSFYNNKKNYFSADKIMHGFL